MAQVGRISGPLLEANLLRQGIANGTQANLSFKNTNSNTTLLKVDVVNGRIGVDTEAPANEVQISQTTQTTNLISDTASIANYTISNNNINVDSGNLYLNAGEHIQLSNLETEQFYITDNYISTKDTNNDIDLAPNGTGTVEVQSNLNVTGNLYSTGNITLDGNITFGDADTDSVDFNSDVNSNIIPDQTDTYSLGYVTKSWDELHTKLVNGQELNTSTVSVNGIDLTHRAGNIIYVSKDGIDTNVGDHPNGSLLTIEEAIARVDSSTAGPVTIRISPGVYEENLPLVIPSDVSVQGVDIRNVVVKPAAGSESKDVFHVDDNTTISDLTIKDYQYNSGNNTGYAFRFSPNAVITNRSPYIQNVTVITKGTPSLDWAEIATTLLGIAVGAISSGAIYDFFTSTNSASGDEQGDLTGNGTITPGDGTAAVYINNDRANAETLYPGQAAHWNAMEVALIAEYNADPTSFESLIDTSDPRGFAAGDAGKGAWIDGAELDSASIEASMLFHAATFITPGVDAITMTNGVRVEWLNSFTYFANRGLYAVNGSTGRTAYGTTNYGAEVRSIGSASVYGNYGAVVDGSDTLMYLIQHNFGYIGAGKFVDNDDSRAIQSQEVTELNSGKINFVTTDHTGGFRIGDNFFVDFETGNTTINIDTLTVNQFNALRVNTGADTTVIDGAFIDTGNLILANNLIQSDSGDLNLASATGKINLQDNTGITGNLDISGDFSFGGALNIGGDQATDSLTLNAALDQDFNPHQHQIFSLGSFAKKWLQAHLDKIETPDIDIYDNVIETKTSDADLELRAAGTGNIRITDSARFTNNVTINGTTNILDDLSITDSVLPIVGDVNQTGSFTVSEDADIGQNINVGASAQFEEILVDDNFITTTTTNTPLELRAAGTGTVNLQDSVNVTNNLTAGDTTATNANITLNAIADNANIGNIEINDNNISATSTDSNLILNADDEVRVRGTDTVFEQDLTVSGLTLFGGSTTVITGTLTHTGDRGTNSGSDLTLNGELTVDNVYIEDNFITTTSGNLILQATGDIDVDSNNVEIANNLDVDGVTNLDVTNIDGTITHVGDRIQTGNYDIGGELTVDNVYIEDNFITTTAGNLSLGATGDINVDANDVVIANNLTVSGTTSLQDTVITGTVTHIGNTTHTGNLDIAGEISNGDILIEDNFITTTETNSDLELRTSGTGEVIIDPSDTVTINNNLTVGGTLTYQGALTINGDVALLGNTQDGSLTVTDNFDVTGTLDISSQAQFEDVRIEDNFITTTQSNSDLELRASGTGEVLVPNNNVQVNNNLFTASISTGDITVNNDLVLNEIVIPPSIIEIDDNFISTKVSNADLELRATGDVVVQENTIIEQNLTVNGDTNLQDTTINGTLTQVGNTTQTGNYDLTGNLTVGMLTMSRPLQVGDINISGNVVETIVSDSNLDLRAVGTGQVRLQENVDIQNNLTVRNFNVDSINVANSVDLEIIELSTDVQFEDNVITTTNTNSNLELRAAGTGSVLLQNIEINNDIIGTNVAEGDTLTLTIAPTEDLIIDSTESLQIPRGTTVQRIQAQDSFLDGGSALNSGTILDGGDAATIFGASDTIYNSGASLLTTSGNVGDIRFNTDDNVFEGTGLTSTISLGGVYSENRQTSVTANTATNTIQFAVNSTTVGETNADGLTIHSIQTDDINLDDNIISTTVSNSDLDLRANGTGELVLDDLSFKNNNIKDNGNNVIIKHTNFGHAKIAGSYGVVVPSGATVVPSPAPQVGDTRWNTTTNLLETWDGTTYVTSAGVAAAITAQEFDDLLLEYTLIFG